MTKEKMRSIMACVKERIGQEVEAFEGDPPPWMIDKLILEISNEISRTAKGG